MKKTVFLTTLLMAAATFSSYSNDKMDPLNEEPKAAIKTLTVDADVTIVLINNSSQEVSMVGDEAFMNQVSFKQNGNSLVVKSSRDRNFKGKGIIYVPAASLNQITVNSAAHVKSAGILNNPDLKVSVNGQCKVHVLTSGKVSPESKAYEVHYYSRDLYGTDPLTLR